MPLALAALKQAQKDFNATPSAYHWRALEAAMMAYQMAYNEAQDAIAAAVHTAI
jgi:hypothetical protein